jgi:ribosomal protein S18 acetylase RimI-like enzyme
LDRRVAWLGAARPAARLMRGPLARQLKSYNMYPNIEIRIATEDDFNQLARIRWQARVEGGEDHTNISTEDFKKEFNRVFKDWARDGNVTSWIALIDGTIVAHISVYKVGLLPRPIKLTDHFGVITENYTFPQFRNLGIGSDLMRHVIDWAHQQDYELLIVYPSKEARSFYARAGFQEGAEVMELRLRQY